MRVTTADVLLELAELATLDEGSPQSFRVRASEKARRGIEAAGVDVTAMSPEELVAIGGVGPSIAAAISELVATGTAAALDRLRAAYPPGVVAVSRVPGIGPETLALFRDRLGVESIADLGAAVAGHRRRDLPGVGPAREERIARALARLALDRVPAAVALPTPSASPPRSRPPKGWRAAPSPPASAGWRRPSATSTSSPSGARRRRWTPSPGRWSTVGGRGCESSPCPVSGSTSGSSTRSPPAPPSSRSPDRRPATSSSAGGRPSVVGSSTSTGSSPATGASG